MSKTQSAIDLLRSTVVESIPFSHEAEAVRVLILAYQNAMSEVRAERRRSAAARQDARELRRLRKLLEGR